MLLRKLAAYSIITAAFTFSIGCSHPIEILRPHAHVAELGLFEQDTILLAQTVHNESWTGSIEITALEDHKITVVAYDFEGGVVSLLDHEDIEIRMEVEDQGMAAWEPWDGYGLLHGFRPGTTRVRFLVWHVSHADLITPWLELSVVAPTS